MYAASHSILNVCVRFNLMTDQKTADLAILQQKVLQAADIAAHGTFSARNPLLGKMTSCPLCGFRHRRFQNLPCLSAKYLPGTENDGIGAAVKHKRKIPRLTRSNPPLFEVHQRLVEMERDITFKEHEGIAGIVEAEIKRRKRTKANKKRDIQKQSRKANRGNK